MVKVLMPVECLRGTGELTIASRIAQALAERGIEVVVASGNTRGFFKPHPLITHVALPAIRYDDKEAKDYLTDDGRRLKNEPGWLTARAHKLEGIFDREQPDAVLISYWPFGNGRVLDHEMDALVKYVKAQPRRVPIFGSIREVLYVDSYPRCGAPGHAAQMVNEHFDKLFVHGDPNFIPLTDGYDYAAALRPEKIHYTGYATAPHNGSARAKKNLIIISAGGGDFRPSSAMVLQRAVGALKHMDKAFLRGKEIHILAGHSFDDYSSHTFAPFLAEAESVLAGAGAHLKMEKPFPLEEYQKLLSHCALYVGQAGIGTVMDVMTHRYPAVLVPIDEKPHNGDYHFQEQLVRAQKLADRNLFGLVRQDELIPIREGEERLATQVNRIIHSAQNREALDHIQCDGAERTAEEISALMRVSGVAGQRFHRGSSTRGPGAGQRQ